MVKGLDSTNTMNVVQLVDQIMLYNSMRTIYWPGSLNFCLTYLKNCAYYEWKQVRNQTQLFRAPALPYQTIRSFTSLKFFMPIFPCKVHPFNSLNGNYTDAGLCFTHEK